MDRDARKQTGPQDRLQPRSDRDIGCARRSGRVRLDRAYFFLANVIVFSSFFPFFNPLLDFLAAMRFSFFTVALCGQLGPRAATVRPNIDHATCDGYHLLNVEGRRNACRTRCRAGVELFINS